MKPVLRHGAIALAVALTLSLAACQPDAEADTEAADPSAETAQDANDLVTPGLAGEQEQASYMVGMDIANSLEPIKEEIDLDIMVQAIETTLAEGELLLNEEQALQVREAFATRLQAKQLAEMQAQAETNQAEGAAFLAANAQKPGVQVTESGLQYQALTQGEGATPASTDQVRVHYKGMLLDGSTFDSSYERDEPAIMPLEHVVPGWQEGIVLMPVGSQYRFWIPSELGYGQTGTPGGPIGPNQTLVFEVELLEIVQPTAE